MLAWTLVFLCVAGITVLRMRRAFGVSRQVALLELSIDSLLAERAEQQHALGILTGETLREHARALGLREASDSELVTLSIPREP